MMGLVPDNQVREKLGFSAFWWWVFKSLFPVIYCDIARTYRALHQAEEYYIRAERRYSRDCPGFIVWMSDETLDERLALAAGRSVDANS